MATTTMEGVFSDEVFTTTELNRHAGALLDRARNTPVTISRNNEQFALLPREQAAKLYFTLNRMRSALALLAEAHNAGISTEPCTTNFPRRRRYLTQSPSPIRVPLSKTICNLLNLWCGREDLNLHALAGTWT